MSLNVRPYDNQTLLLFPPRAGDRRPALAKLGHDVGPDTLLLEAKPLAGLPLPPLGPVLSAVGQVAAVGRGSVPA